MNNSGSISINQQTEIVNAIGEVAEIFKQVDITAGTAKVNITSISDNNGGRISL